MHRTYVALFVFAQFTTSVYPSTIIHPRKTIENGVFENVQVFYYTQSNETKKSLIIDYDDNLANYMKNIKVKTLIISNQFVTKLPPHSVSDLPTISNLTLISNEIRDVKAGAFRNLPNLEHLNLSHNHLEDIRNNVFTNLSGIKTLDLRNNKIARIANKAFNNLRQLCHLFLQNNRITRWNREWLAGSTVTFLNMGHNLIDDLPPNAFNSMLKPSSSNAITINDDIRPMSVAFDHNQLKKIGNNVFNGITKYDTINLEGNSIQNVDGHAFDKVQYINTLNLNNNSIGDFNPNLLNWTKVNVLMLEDNRLRCLSTQLFANQLEELDIDGNLITCACVKIWLDWRGVYSNPSIFHITNLEQDCI